jgi:hypothetical protein
MEMVLASRTWLSLTPEPERELPDAIATLRADGHPSTDEIAAERERAERLIKRANRRAWTRWLSEARSLAISRAKANDDPTVAEAARRATAVIENHDALAQGITPRPRGKGPKR